MVKFALGSKNSEEILILNDILDILKKRNSSKMTTGFKDLSQLHPNIGEVHPFDVLNFESDDAKQLELLIFLANTILVAYNNEK